MKKPDLKYWGIILLIILTQLLYWYQFFTTTKGGQVSHMGIGMNSEVQYKSLNPINVWSSGVVPNTEIGTSLCVSPHRPSSFKLSEVK